MVWIHLLCIHRRTVFMCQCWCATSSTLTASSSFELLGWHIVVLADSKLITAMTQPNWANQTISMWTQWIHWKNKYFVIWQLASKANHDFSKKKVNIIWQGTSIKYFIESIKEISVWLQLQNIRNFSIGWTSFGKIGVTGIKELLAATFMTGTLCGANKSVKDLNYKYFDFIFVATQLTTSC